MTDKKVGLSVEGRIISRQNRIAGEIWSYEIVLTVDGYPGAMKPIPSANLYRSEMEAYAALKLEVEALREYIKNKTGGNKLWN